MRPYLPLLVALHGLWTLAASIGQASNFNISVETAEKYGCGQVCQKTLAETNPGDIATWGTKFDFDFYATASSFTGSKPGDILKMQPINATEVSFPAGVTVYKFQYTSADIDGSSVPSTGFIAFPFAKTKKPFRLIVYAHGTSGVFRGCAPSTSPTLNDYKSWTTLLLAGFAVVATDYAGIGNNYTDHKYVKPEDTF